MIITARNVEPVIETVNVELTATEASNLMASLNTPGGTYGNFWDEKGPGKGVGKGLYKGLQAAGVKESK